VIALQESRRSGRLRTIGDRDGVHAVTDYARAGLSCMSGLKLDDGVRTLLETKLDSFEKLEIVRTLLASGKAMSHPQLETACQLSSELIEDALPSLQRSNIVELNPVDRSIRLGIASQDPRFVALMQLYNEDRAGVLAVLSSAVMQRLRSMTARAFADAFVIRKKRDGNG
jgi:hypothetical protein